MPEPSIGFPPMADLHRGPSGQRGGEMPTKLTAEPIVGASPPIAPASTSSAPPASGRSRRRRSCGVAEGKPAGALPDTGGSDTHRPGERVMARHGVLGCRVSHAGR